MHALARELVPLRNCLHHVGRRPGRPFALLLTSAVTSTAVVAALLSPPAATAAQSTGPVRVGPRFFGVHDGSGQAYGRVTFGALRIWDAGTTWRDIETSPGHDDWSRLDQLVSNARAHGVRVMLVLGMTPSFYADSPSLPPTQLNRFADYVRAVMERYRWFGGTRGIESYQVWNEGNVNAFWTGTPHQLAQLTAIVDRVRDQVDPGARVVAPSFATRLQAQRQWISAYQRQRIGSRPVWRHYDVNALSLYPRATYDGRAGGPEDAVRLLGRVRSRLQDAGVPRSVPIWATEINYGLRSGPPGTNAATPISQRRQVANVLRTYLLGAARGLARVYWYRYDWGRIAGGGTLGNTLLTDPDDWTQVTPAGLALHTAERWLRGRLVARPGHRRPCDHNRAGTYRCIVRHGDQVRRILWNPHRTVRVRIDGALSRENQRGRRTTMTGGTTTVEVDYRPVMVNVRA